MTFDADGLLILVSAPDIELGLQDLVNQARDWEDSIVQAGGDDDIGIINPVVLEATGKQDVGGGLLRGIVVEMQNGWRIKFEDRLSATVCRINGGTLADVAGLPPVDFSANVMVIVSQATEGALVDDDASGGSIS